MKRLIFLLLITIPFLGFGQSVNLTWEDSQGREFSINSHSGKFKYSMVSGDQIYYNGRYDSGPEGSVKKIGSVSIYYNGRYDGGPEGSVKKVGSVSIYYNGRYDSGPEGSVKKIGGMSVYYNGRYDNGPEGSFKKTTGTISY